MKNKFLLSYYDFIRDIKGFFIIFITISLGIVLSIVTFLFIKSFISYKEALIKPVNDPYDIAFFDATYENYSRLYQANDKNIERIFITHSLGYASLEENIINRKKYMLIQEMTLDELETEEFVIEEGRLPLTNSEILVPKEYADIYGIKLNENILYSVGNLTIDGVNYTNYYSRANITYDDINSYDFTDSIDRVYKVVGIYSSSNNVFINNTNITHYYAYSLLSSRILEKDAIVDVIIKLYDDVTIDANIYNGYLNVPNDSKLFVPDTKEVYTDFNKATVYIIVVILLFMMLTFSIKSSYEYGSVKRKEFYSQCITLGATSKQIKKSWNNKTFLLSILGMIFGVFLSIVIVYYFVKIIINTTYINSLIKSMYTIDIVLYSVLIVLIAMIAANKISEEKIILSNPMSYLKHKYESINAKFVHYNGFTKLKGEISKYVKSNFVLKHIKDNKAIIMMCSCFAFLVLFASLDYTVTKPILDYFDSEEVKVDLKVNGDSDYLDYLEYISKFDGIKSYSIKEDIDDPLYIKYDKELIGTDFLKVVDNETYLPIHIIVLPNDEFEKYSKDRDIILDSTIYYNKYGEIIGIPLNLELEDISIYTNSYFTFYLKNVLVTNITEPTLNKKDGYINLLVKENAFIDKFGKLNHKKINYNKLNLVLNDEKKFLEKYDSFVSEKGLNITSRYVTNSVLVESNYIYVSYVLGIILIVISSILIFESVCLSLNTYVKSREKELSLLKTVGTSSKNINDIINGEYGNTFFISSLIGIVIGLILCGIFKKIFNADSVINVSSSVHLLIYYISMVVLMIILFNVCIKLATRDLRKKRVRNFIDIYFREF